MAGISRAERERRADARAKVAQVLGKASQDALVQPYADLAHPEFRAHPDATTADLSPEVRTISLGYRAPSGLGDIDPALCRLDPPVTGKRPQDGERMLEAWTPSALARLHALCAALPYSGVPKDPWTPLSFADRLEAAKVNAELILLAVGERNG